MKAYIKGFAQRVAALCLAIIDNQENYPRDVVSAAKSLLKSAERIIERLK